MKFLGRISWKWALAALLLAIPLVLGWMYLFVDGPPVDDSDLAFQPRPIRHEDNGWLVLGGKLDRVYWPERGADAWEEGAVEGPQDRAYRMLEEGVFDGELAREILEKNAEVLVAYERTWALPEVRWWVDAKPPLDFPPSFKGLRILCQVASLRSLSWEARGDPARAFQEAIQVLRLARKVRASSRTGVEFLMANGYEATAVWSLHGLLRRNRKSVSRLTEMGKEIIAGASSPLDAARMVRGEYAFATEVFRQWKSGEADVDEISSLVPRPWEARMFLLPRQTRSLLAEVARSSIRNASRPWKDQAPFPAPACVHQELGGWLRLFPVRNGIGKYGVAIHASGLETSTKRWLDARLRCLLLGTWIAVEGHRAERGRLPASLAELVPSRLDEVPLDPYDGEPIRYSAERGIIRSVGSDFIDAGGSTAETWENALQDDAEPTLRIDG